MKQFLNNNKIFIAVIIGAFIIGGAIYFSHKPAPITVSSNNEKVTKDLATTKSPKILKCIDYTEAPNHIGEYSCIKGKIDHIYTSKKGTNFLNFCADYKSCPIYAVIFNSDSHKFSDIKNYNKKTIEITGLIKTYKGRAEIIINDPNQIKIK